MTAKIRREADRGELTRFVEATFRYADEGTHAVLRTFAEGSNEVLGTVRVPLNGTGLDPLIEHATHQATKAANAARPAVFAPPVATFVGSSTRESDLGNGLVLTVEADQKPTIARRNLQFVLGPPTVVVASGGYWTDSESGKVEDKLHLHWRCKEPSRTSPEHALLKGARALACAFVGADATAVSLVHTQRFATLRTGQEAESDLGGAGDRGRSPLQLGDGKSRAAGSRVQGLREAAARRPPRRRSQGVSMRPACPSSAPSALPRTTLCRALERAPARDALAAW